LFPVGTAYAGLVRWFLLGLFSFNLCAQQFSFEPAEPKQGQVLKVSGDAKSANVRLDQRTVRLFPQQTGHSLGLMPVSVLAKPGNYELEWLDSKGATIHKARITVLDAHYARQNVVLTKALSRLRSTPDERASVTAFLKEVLPERYWQEPLEAPIPGCITSPFGVTRYHNGKPTGEYHAGLDQRGAMGSPIHAIAGGTVKIVHKFELRGGTVAIDHGEGLQSIYLHMSDFAVKIGDHVKQGEVIGYVGSTGRSTAPHLHWTLYANGQPVTPLQWIHGLKTCTSAANTPHLKRPMTH
jgi:murein DD-endopeptidase MepM/ murein hydrolase activator NlpD